MIETSTLTEEGVMQVKTEVRLHNSLCFTLETTCQEAIEPMITTRRHSSIAVLQVWLVCPILKIQ